MAMKLNDVSANKAFLYLRDSQKALADSLSRLSSGKRITKAADDASGMAIANSLESQVRGLGQSIRNATDAIAVAQVADGALGESAEIIMTIREKALQAANASQTYESRQALQADIGKALTALNDIAANTSYNGQKLLSGQFTDKSFQVGAYSGETVDLNIANAAPETLGGDEGNLTEINVLTPESAQQALSITDDALARLDAIRSELGSTQNQLSSSISNLSLTLVNAASAESQILDLDFAEESMNLARMQVLEKAGVFAITQTGKINRQSMLDLLQGRG
ncbi:MAG: flagellin [Deltaproteobacteria bacterium]|nr:flagellin [Deltaproteobacteria bacterium]